MPLACSTWPTLANKASPSLCFSSRRRNFSSVVAPGTRSRPRSMPTKRRSKQRVFACHVSQVEPVLHEVHPQHALQAHGRSAVAGLRVVRLDHATQLRVCRARLREFTSRRSLPGCASSEVQGEDAVASAHGRLSARASIGHGYTEWSRPGHGNPEPARPVCPLTSRAQMNEWGTRTWIRHQLPPAPHLRPWRMRDVTRESFPAKAPLIHISLHQTWP